MLTPDQIRKYPVFANLDEDELARLAAHLTKRSFAKGAYLFYPGTPTLNTYLVESGLVRLFFTNAAGQEFLINLIEPYDMFGYPVLHDDQFRVVGAAVHQPSVILSIPCSSLLRLMDASPQLMRNLYQEVSINARRLLLNTRRLITTSLEGRLASALLHLTPKDGGTNIIDMPLTQAELASWVGASRGRLNRALNDLQKRGFIRVDGSKIIILDFPGLQHITGEHHFE